jgi:hypothetical protein
MTHARVMSSMHTLANRKESSEPGPSLWAPILGMVS